MKRVFSNLVVLIIVITCASTNAQETTFSFDKDSIVPKSIYQSQFLKQNSFTPFALNSQLLKTRMEFTFLDTQEIVEGYYLIPLSFSGKRPTKYIYETYKDIYHKKDLQKSFYNLSKLYYMPAPKKH